ncbi:MAG TPA: hypothetical protein VEU55_09910 [Gemmatimonadales bacterium]|nr:hypothetical protein [Gemmatimonadales bacterium]
MGAVLCVAAAAALAAQAAPHVIAATVGREPVGLPPIDQRIHTAAERFRAYAAVPRHVVVAVAFPADSAEYTALSGYALLIVTALVQHAAELPLRRVYVRAAARETELENLTWVESEETGVDSLAARTLGRYREDAVYLLPIALYADPAALVVDFAANRTGQVVSQFDGLPADVTWLPPGAPTAPRPGEGALVALLAREYPGFLTR